MKGDGREKDNFFSGNSHLRSNIHQHFHNNNSTSSCSYDTTKGYNVYDVGSSSMILPCDPSQFSTQKNHFVDHQYSVGPNVYNSCWYGGSNNGGGGGVMMDELSLTREFQRMDIGTRVASDGLGIGDGSVAKIRPSNVGKFAGFEGLVNGFSSNVDGVEGFSSPLCKDERNHRSVGGSLSSFGDLVGTNSPYVGGVGYQDCLINNNPLGENVYQREEYYGNGVGVVKGNRLLYDDRVSLYDSRDNRGHEGKISRVNEFGNGNMVQRRDAGYGTEFPGQFQSMYDPLTVDDSLQQYLMEGCKELFNSWANSQNYGVLLQHYGEQVMGEVGGLNSLGSSQLLHSNKQALTRGNALYSTVRGNIRAGEHRNNPSYLSMSKKIRQPYTGYDGLNGSTGRSIQSDAQRKTLLGGNTMQKVGDRSFDYNGSLYFDSMGGPGSPVGSCDSLVLQTIYSSLAEVEGNIYHMAKDQNGCRFLQKKFEDGSFEDVETIFNEIAEHVVELMINPFGNYLIQKLLDVCNDEQRMKIVQVVTKNRGDLVRICLNTHGTRVVQKLIDGLKTRKQISLIIRSLEPGFLDLIKDLNGNHVVQRCLQCLNCDDNKFIFDAAAKFCVDIATHRHGCCVLQRCIAHSNGDHRKKLIDEICNNALVLAQDPFGNYVVQYIVELKIPSAAAQLMTRFEGNYVQLSMQKFSSHVVEKCLKFIEESHARIVYELISVPNFEQLLQDPFANYVVQSALEVTKGPLNDSLVTAVRPHSILRTNPYCKKIFTRGLIRK